MAIGYNESQKTKEYELTIEQPGESLKSNPGAISGPRVIKVTFYAKNENEAKSYVSKNAKILSIKEIR